MKKVTLLLLILTTTITYSQVGINTDTPDASSALEIKSTSTGILIPRMTEAQRDAIASPALSLMIYQTNNDSGFYFFDGRAWKKIEGVAGPQGVAGTNGTNGQDGDSAYQIWLDAGNTGTEADFLSAITGTDGTNGTNGQDGDSAYQIWLDAGNTGTEADFLNALKGTDGADGTNGTNGQDGDSAYQIWLNAGNTGTEADFLNALKGTDARGISNVIENDNGTITFVFTDNTTFTTSQPNSNYTNLPNIQGVTLKNLTSTVIDVESEVLPSAGTISTRGFVWSTNPSPTVSDNYINVDGQVGVFRTEISTTLSPNTTYYIRAFSSSDFGFKYGEESSFTTETIPSIGDFRDGGRVFYVDSNYFYVAASRDKLGSWGTTSNISTNDEDGYNNTLNLQAAGSTMANNALNHSEEGFEDWYIPSINELTRMYSNRVNARISQHFNYNNYYGSSDYYSSTQSSAGSGKGFKFYNSGSQITISSSNRPVRYIRKSSL